MQCVLNYRGDKNGRKERETWGALWVLYFAQYVENFLMSNWFVCLFKLLIIYNSNIKTKSDLIKDLLQKLFTYWILGDEVFVEGVYETSGLSLIIPNSL